VNDHWVAALLFQCSKYTYFFLSVYLTHILFTLSPFFFYQSQLAFTSCPDMGWALKLQEFLPVAKKVEYLKGYG